MKPMATRNNQTEAWWETALAALGMLVLLAALLVAWILLEAGQHEPEERCFVTAMADMDYCRTQGAWE